MSEKEMEEEKQFEEFQKKQIENTLKSIYLLFAEYPMANNLSAINVDYTQDSEVIAIDIESFYKNLFNRKYLKNPHLLAITPELIKCKLYYHLNKKILELKKIQKEEDSTKKTKEAKIIISEIADFFIPLNEEVESKFQTMILQKTKDEIYNIPNILNLLD